MEPLELVVAALIVAVTVFLARFYLGGAKNPSAVPAKKDKIEEKKVEEADDKIPVTVFYGSQSGTAETFANEICDNAKSHGFKATLVDLDEFDEDEFPETKFGVFLMSTFGEGEPTDNAIRFYEWLLSDDREPDMLSKMNFAVFALGNKQYEHYCAVGRKVDQQLRKLGAHGVLECGEGDDDGSLEDDFTDWQGRFWSAARSHFKVAGGSTEDEEFKASVGITWFALPTSAQNGHAANDEAVDKKRVVIDKNAPPVPATYVPGMSGFVRHTDQKHRAEITTVITNRELRQDTSDGGSVRHIELDLSTTRLRYLTADNMGVYPRNDFKQVAKVAQRLGVDSRAVFKLERKPHCRKVPLPSPCSVQDALLWYCDFNSLARAKLLKTLAQYATDPAEKAQLLHLSSDAKAREDWLAEHKSIYEVLMDFPSVLPPFEHFLDWVPKLQPRFYTISSSSKAHSRTVHLTVALTRVQKADGRVHQGVCSTYLSSLREGQDQLVVFVRSSSFRLPRKPQTPMIMVGPGTGCAPFRAFIQESTHVKKQGGNLGNITFYFGCRSPRLDFLYKEEFETAQEEGALQELVTAFSREQDQKLYVQHRMEEQARELWKLIHEERATFYVCGAATMGRNVRETLARVAERVGGLSPEKAADYIKRLQNEGRYIQELWA